MPQMRDPNTGQNIQLPYGNEGGQDPMAQMGGGMAGLESLPPELIQLLMMLLQEQSGAAGGQPQRLPVPGPDEEGLI